MNRDLQDIDELFRSGLDGYEETPSTGVKEGLDAALDKQDVEKYKKRFIFWKRAALLLLLLVASFVLYESGIIKTGNGHYTSKNTVADKNDVAANSNETITQDKNNPVRSNNNGIDNSVTVKDNSSDQKVLEKNLTVKENPFIADNIVDRNKTASKNNNRLNKQVNPFAPKQDPLLSATSSKSDNKINTIADYDTGLQTTEKRIMPLHERVNIAKVAEWSVKKISSFQPILVSNSPLTASKTNDSKNKKVRYFKPFWLATPFIAYYQAGYKLDSDEPSAITSIKFREAHEPSFSLGLLLTRQLTPRFGLQSGLIYANSAIGMKPQKTYAFQDPTGDVAYKYITSSGYAFIKPGFGPQPTVGDSLTTAEAKHRIEHISIPLAVKYTVLNKKISITPGAGIEANFITKANLEVDIEDPFNREIVVVRKLNGTKSFYWSFVADAEIKYKVNQKLSINLRPVYRSAISPITKNNVVETFPHSFGIGAGVTIKF